jgi:hypothetical protein
MGFNKRYITSESLMIQKREGIENLVKYIKGPDALIIGDDFSKKVCEIVLNVDKKFLFLELSKIGFY